MENEVKILQTAKGEKEALLWKELEPIHLSEEYNLHTNTVLVNSQKEYQSFRGFGGSFTEAAAYIWANTTKENQKEIVRAYFNKESGLGYNLGRTTIHCCDFALEPYTYIEEGDETLETFSIDRDKKWIIPFLKAAMKEAGAPLELLCSPWSPPPFMKTNHDVNQGGRLKEKYYKLWAAYMVRYIREMRAQGIEISMVSVQNEPEAVQTWASCIFDATQEARFAVDYLYQELKAEGLHEKVKIIIWDHNRDGIYRRVKESFSYPGAKEVIWGVGYHWYVSDKPENLSMVHAEFPDKHLLFTEGCVELVNYSGKTSSDAGIGAWRHGETYGRNIINDMNNYNEAQLDWNLLLDEKGGPNYVGNFCEAPIHVDTKTNEIKYNLSYYYIGHFSRYIRRGAKRLQNFNDVEEKVYATALKNPDGTIVVVVQSELDEPHKIALVVDGKGANIELPAHSITTFRITEDTTG